MDYTVAETRSQQIKFATMLAVPVIMENLLMTTVNIIDTAMVGSLGANATAAVALLHVPSRMVDALVQALTTGVSVMVAKHVGAGNWDRARHGALEAMVLGLSLGLFCFLAMQGLADFIPVWMGGAPDIVGESSIYAHIIAFGYPLFYMGITLGGAMRGAGDTKTPMLVTTTANILNCIGNYLLIYEPHNIGFFGITFHVFGAGLGVRGAAVSTAASTAFSGVLALVIMLSRKEGLVLRLKRHFSILKTDVDEILFVAIPTGLERLTIQGGQIAYLKIISSQGTVVLAAHQIALTAESICYNPGYGFQAAASALTGQSLGAKKPKLAESYGKICMWLGVLVMSFIAVLMFVFAKPFISFFTPDEGVIYEGYRALKAGAFAEPFFAMSLAGSGALRGLGDAKITVPIVLLSVYIVRIPLVAFLVLYLHMGLVGAWIAADIDLFVRGMLDFIRLYSGVWKKKLPAEYWQ